MNIKNENGKIKTWVVALIVIVVLVLIGAGVFAYLFLKTDMFKSNEELFWKYMSKNTEMTSVLKHQQDDRYKDKSYNERINIDFNVNESEFNQLNHVNVSIDTQKDMDSNKTYSKIDTQYKTQKLFDIEFLKDNEIYAIKNTEVANGYIAVENNNLKELAEKIGIETDEIPDKVTLSNYSEIFNISKEEKQHVIDTYYDVIKNTIPKDRYTKREKVVVSVEGTKYDANSYSVTLTERECQNLIINSLEVLRTDSITLNLISTKMKIINKDSQFASINQLNEQIANLIKQVKEKETSDEQFITFTVYESDGKTVSTSIEVINETKILISYISEQNKILISREILKNMEETTWNEISLINKYNETEEYTIFNMKLTNDEEITAEYKKEKTDSGYKLSGRLDVFGNIININGEKQLSEGEYITSLEESTKIILNGLEKEKLNMLITRLKQQITKVIQDKQNIINPPVVDEPIEETITEII